MQRYFIENENILNVNDYIEITNSDYHHIKNVMRMKKGDKVYLSTNKDDSYIGIIDDITDSSIVIKIIEVENFSTELNSFVVIAQGLVRREKSEEVVRRITELGASGYVQVQMERSIVKIKEYDKKNDKTERFEKIVKEASEQSHRRKIPVIYPLCNLKEFIDNFSSFDVKLFAYEESGRSGDTSFKNLIKQGQDKKMVILVGPEGGFSPKEVQILLDNDFKSIGLGKRILRTETAPLFVMSAISYELELGD